MSTLHNMPVTKAIPITTKGDVLVTDGTVPSRLGVGSNNQVLTADSTQTYGFKWAAGSGATVNKSFEETPTGAINGSNTSYTIANTPTAGTLRVYLNGRRLQTGASNDYTLSGTTITMNYAPETFDTLFVDYEY